MYFHDPYLDIIYTDTHNCFCCYWAFFNIQFEFLRFGVANIITARTPLNPQWWQVSERFLVPTTWQVWNQNDLSLKNSWGTYQGDDQGWLFLTEHCSHAKPTLASHNCICNTPGRSMATCPVISWWALEQAPRVHYSLHCVGGRNCVLEK